MASASQQGASQDGGQRNMAGWLSRLYPFGRYKAIEKLVQASQLHTIEPIE